MNSYLANLVSRTLRPSDSVQPRLSPLFAPPTSDRDGPDVFPLAEEAAWRVDGSPRDSEVSGRTEAQRNVPRKASPSALDGDAASLAVPIVGVSQTNDKAALVEHPRRVDRSDPKPSPDPSTTDKTDKEDTANGIVPLVPPAQHVRAGKRLSITDISTLGRPEPPLVIAEPKQITSSPRPARQPPARMLATAAVPPQAVDAAGSIGRLSTSRVENVGPASAVLRGAMERDFARDRSLVQPGPLPMRSSQSLPNLPRVRGSTANKPGDDVSPFVGPRSIFGRHQPADAPVKAAAATMPSIEVTIGRIDVRATASSLPSKPARLAVPVVGLEEYLRRRSERSSE